MAKQLDETDLDEIIDFCSKDLITGHILHNFSCFYDNTSHLIHDYNT